MEIRKANINEIETIKEIYSSARNFMELNGNKTQWKKNYPDENTIISDINDGSLYVCISENQIAAVFCFFIGIEPTYNKIYDGSWLNNEKYGVIHRIAVAVHKKGIASACIQWCINQFGNIKIDTHKDNIPMQKTILKNGFSYCGIITKEDGSERLAYQIAK